MDKKVYERTRYQNIYRHKKNKNYVVMISKPVKTSISKIDGKKIFTIEEAIKIRDKENNNASVKHNFNEYKGSIDALWNKYIYCCKNVKKMAYNTILRKEKMYNKFIKGKFDKSLHKTTKMFWINVINNLECSDKQKNHMLKELKAFFNWCVEEDLLNSNMLTNVKKFTVPKAEMKYWNPTQLKKFLQRIEIDLQSNNIITKKKAYIVKMLTLIGFNLGDRIGETRALTFGCVDNENCIIYIKHSINYDRKSKDWLSNTKNYQSQRKVDVSQKLIDEIEKYKKFLISEQELNIDDNTIIFFNHSNNAPYSDATLRKHFYKYCELANVPKIRLYDLRHTYVATMMLENRELYQISERIGHSDFSTTINKYGHLSNEVRKEIAKTTDKYF